MDVKLTAEQRQDIMNWDVENWSKALPFWMERTRLDLSKCHALEIGSHNGGISLFLALHGANVVCSDLNGPTEGAKALHRKHHVDSLVSYASVNALSLPYPDNSFDLVAFKSVMGGKGVYPQRETIPREIYRVLKPGGEMWFAENLRGSALHMAARNGLLRRTNEWWYFSQDEISELCAQFPTKSFKQYGCVCAFNHGSLAKNNAVQKALGTIDSLIDGVIPARWKYIVFGIAGK